MEFLIPRPERNLRCEIMAAREALDVLTRPTVAGYQLIRRQDNDQYGAARGRKASAQDRPIVTRNGLPVRFYRYRGTGQSRPELDAQWIRDRRQRETR